jgi:uncharacterized membrane protein
MRNTTGKWMEGLRLLLGIVLVISIIRAISKNTGSAFVTILQPGPIIALVWILIYCSIMIYCGMTALKANRKTTKGIKGFLILTTIFLGILIIKVALKSIEQHDLFRGVLQILAAGTCILLVLYDLIEMRRIRSNAL